MTSGKSPGEPSGRVFGLVLAAGLLFGGCSGEAQRPDLWTGFNDGGAGAGTAGDGSAGDGSAGAGPAGEETAGAPGAEAGSGSVGGCVEGQQRECLVVHDLANGVRSCWTGMRRCSEGRWGECEASPQVTELPLPD